MEQQGEAYLGEQMEKIPTEIKGLEEEQVVLEEKIEEERLYIDFIGEVYPLLSHKNDELNQFVKEFQNTLKLFSKEPSSSDFYTITQSEFEEESEAA